MKKKALKKKGWKIQSVADKMEVAGLRASGKTMKEIGEKVGVSKQAVSLCLKKEDMGEYVREAQVRLLSSLPSAVDNVNVLVNGMRRLNREDYKGKQLGFDASKLVMSSAGIVPTSSQTMVITNILNQQSIVLSPVVQEVLKQSSRGMADFIDVETLEDVERNAVQREKEKGQEKVS